MPSLLNLNYPVTEETFEQMGFLEGIKDQRLRGAVAHNMVVVANWMLKNTTVPPSTSVETCIIPIIRRVTCDVAKFSIPPEIKSPKRFFFAVKTIIEQDKEYYNNLERKFGHKLEIDREAQACFHVVEAFVNVFKKEYEALR